MWRSAILVQYSWNIAEPIRVYSLQVEVAAAARPTPAPAPEKTTPPRLSIVVLRFANVGTIWSKSISWTNYREPDDRSFAHSRSFVIAATQLSPTKAASASWKRRSHVAPFGSRSGTPIARRSTYSYGIVEFLWPLECAVSPLGIILVIVLILLLFGGLGGGSVVPYWGYGYGFGHGGVGVVGIILIVVIVLLLMGRL
jgi:hypothetical protein